MRLVPRSLSYVVKKREGAAVDGVCPILLPTRCGKFDLFLNMVNCEVAGESTFEVGVMDTPSLCLLIPLNSNICLF